MNDAKNKVSVIGSGNVGANTAFFIAENDTADVLLFDVREGISTGKSLDIMEAAPVRTYRTGVTGTDSIEDIVGSRVVLIAAGEVRTPGVQRIDLFDRNAGIIEGLARDIARLAPEAVVLVMTEPVDLMTALFTQRSGLPRERVLGVGALLDAVRLRFAVSRNLALSHENVTALVMGAHGRDLIAPPRYTTVSGVPVLRLMNEDQFSSLIDEVRGAGDFIVELSSRGSAYYAPSSAAAELVSAVVRNVKRILPVSMLLDGELGVRGAALSLPAVLGGHGAARVLEPGLTSEETAQFRNSAGVLKEILHRRAV